MTRTPTGNVAFCGTWPKGNPATTGTFSGSSRSRNTSSNVWRYSLVFFALGSWQSGLMPMAMPATCWSRPQLSKVGQHPVEAIGFFAQVFEEEDPALERRLPRRAMVLQSKVRLPPMSWPGARPRRRMCTVLRCSRARYYPGRRRASASCKKLCSVKSGMSFWRNPSSTSGRGRKPGWLSSGTRNAAW